MTFSLLPAVLVLLPDSQSAATRESQRWEAIISRLIAFPIANARWVLMASVVLGTIGAFGLTRLTADANPLSYWREGHPTRQAFEFVSKRLVSIEGVELRLSGPLAIEDSEAIATIAKVEERIRQTAGVTGVRSLVSVLRIAAHALGASDVTDENAGELLTLVSLGDSAALEPWISIDHRSLRVSIAAKPATVESRELLLRRIQKTLEDLPPDWRVEMTGPSALQRAIDRVVRDSAVQAFSGTTAVVAGLVALFLGSLRWGGLAMIPNLLPMVVLFGMMGLFGIALDAGTALVAPIAIGIAVDDTIHFLHEFRAQRKNGLGALDATKRAGLHVGRAIVITSATLAAGFLAMLVSRFQSMANIGLLSAACIATAFIAELLVLPALIAFFADDEKVRGIVATNGAVR
jgi:predicted RND superfamily exporter protein